MQIKVVMGYNTQNCETSNLRDIKLSNLKLLLEVIFCGKHVLLSAQSFFDISHSVQLLLLLLREENRATLKIPPFPLLSLQGS